MKKQRKKKKAYSPNCATLPIEVVDHIEKLDKGQKKTDLSETLQGCQDESSLRLDSSSKSLCAAGRVAICSGGLVGEIVNGEGFWELIVSTEK